MRYHADFSQPVFIHPADYQWLPSPAKGVERMMLDRIGDEVARATSIVRYAPNSHFPEHAHNGGEEILVLDGVFGDEHGKYPRGTYLRNPIGTSHSPVIGSEGALILVKLHQFDVGDTAPCIIDTTAGITTGTDKYKTQHLHHYGIESVYIRQVPALTSIESRSYEGGAEYFVVEGECIYEGQSYPAGSWLRFPSGFTHSFLIGEHDTTLWHKKGHLPK